MRCQEIGAGASISDSSMSILGDLGMEKRPLRFSLPEAFFEGSRSGGREDCLSTRKQTRSEMPRDPDSLFFFQRHRLRIYFCSINPPCPLRELRGKQEGVSGKVGVPQRREKRFGNGVKNLSGSADIPKLPITRMEMEPGTGYYFPPRRIRAGRVMIALRRSKTALTVIPRSRKGRDRSQTKGYRMSANRARGQQKTKRISHKRNLIIRGPPRIPVILRSP